MKRLWEMVLRFLGIRRGICMHCVHVQTSSSYTSISERYEQARCGFSRVVRKNYQNGLNETKYKFPEFCSTRNPNGRCVWCNDLIQIQPTNGGK